MFTYNQYLRATSLDEAYELYQKKNNCVLGGTLWLKMQDRNVGVAIDLMDLGLDRIQETEEDFVIGAYVSLRELETSSALKSCYGEAVAEAVKHIVGVQFRNCATLGGSIFGRFGFSDVYTVFEALGAKAIFHGAGEIPLEEYATYPRNFRDILVGIRVPKAYDKVVYLSQRNTATDFPVLTCAVAKKAGEYRIAIGARPGLSRLLVERELTEKTAESLAERLEFGSNLRAGAAYRKVICRVLLERAAGILGDEEVR